MTSESDYSGKTDKMLLQHLEIGDQDAATEVFDRHSPRLLATARLRLGKLLSSRVDPEDIVQSTFKSFFRRAKNGSYLAPESGDLFNLLIVIAMRKINGRSQFHQSALRDVRKTQTGISDHLVQHSDDQRLRELCMALDDVCQGLTEVQRNIVTLRLEGYSVEEISDVARRSKRTVERELQNFRKLLSGYFEP